MTPATTVGHSPARNDSETRSRLRIVAVFEPGASGAAVLAQAATLGASQPIDLTVVAIVAQATGPHCCGASPIAYNRAVRDAAAAELHQAAQLLGPDAENARFVLLLDGRHPPLPAWVGHNAFDLVLLPARRRVPRAPAHPAMRRLRHLPDVEVRIVKAPTHASRPQILNLIEAGRPPEPGEDSHGQSRQLNLIRALCLHLTELRGARGLGCR